MAKKRDLCDLGKAIKTNLLERNETQEWLIEKVKVDTGLFFDGSYMYKILTGQIATPKIVESISKILDL